MKTIQTVSILSFILIMLVCLVGCGSEGSGGNDATAPETTVTTKVTVPSEGTSATVTEPSGENTQPSEDPSAPTGSETDEPTDPTTLTPSGTTTTEATTNTTTSSGTTSGATSSSSTKPMTTTTKKPTTTATTKPSGGGSQPPKPVTLTALPESSYYGYQYLSKMVSNSSAYVTAYKRVVLGINAMQESISLEDLGLTDKQMKTVMRCYHADYPQHFWYNGAYSYITSGAGVTLSVAPTYTMTPAQKQTAQPKVDAAVKELLKKAAYGQTAYERELILHDELAARVTYIDGTNGHNLYGALVEGKAVCEGYARAFQYLMYQAGTQCLFVEGTSIRPGGSKGEAHAWNLVEIGGKYYHTDVTWDDQSNAKIPVMHAFFNLNDALIKEGHTISADNPYPIPTCNATNESYFVKEGTELQTFSVDKVADLFIKGNGSATIYVSKKTVNEFIAWFQENISAICSKASLAGKTFSLQSCGREVIITTK